jgi:NADH:ubiquinone oxidoreductase subunit 3 (subunit A)
MNSMINLIVIYTYTLTILILIAPINPIISGIHYKELRVVKNELSSQYECGFIPSSDSRIQFEVQLYLISSSFIVFDVEIALILPYSLVIMENGFHGPYSIHYSSLMLGSGSAFEWKSGLSDLGGS